MKIPSGSTLLFIGDSITDCDRSYPVGEKGGLGNGYVNLINAILGAHSPQYSLRMLNTGISGNRIPDLKARWQSDVLDLKPDWLSVMIGINDVWRQFDSPGRPGQVSLDRYVTIYRQLLEQTKPLVEGIVLMSPYYIEKNPEDDMRRLMDRYGQAVKQLAEEYNTEFVDVQAAFDAFLVHNPTQALCGDRVHSNTIGHMLIARAFMQTMGFTWD